MQQIQAAAEQHKLQGREATLDQIIKENESLKQLIANNEQQLNAIQSELVHLRTQTVAHQHKLNSQAPQQSLEEQHYKYEDAGNRLEKQVKQLKELSESYQSSPVIDSKELVQSLEQLVSHVKQGSSSSVQDPSHCIAQLFYEQQALSALVYVHNLWLTSIQNKNSPPETMEAIRRYLDWIRETCNEIYSMTQLLQKHCWETLGVETESISLPTSMLSSSSSSSLPAPSRQPTNDNSTRRQPYSSLSRNTKSTNPFDDDD
ncbi:hypothetical protein GAYE_SCF25G4463 [Galdieria yellowstonensis]|uniref:Uncharacterized protein n=1 Tax=Galdieria yellowstonensis TaxID=3028027 RepID=A0AAV9IGR3_9RHOD|nr:hypothetical protein GAYE_SCF25G4463 [Galdieria yellowstonensis]